MYAYAPISQRFNSISNGMNYCPCSQPGRDREDRWVAAVPCLVRPFDLTEILNFILKYPDIRVPYCLRKGQQQWLIKSWWVDYMTNGITCCWCGWPSRDRSNWVLWLLGSTPGVTEPKGNSVIHIFLFALCTSCILALPYLMSPLFYIYVRETWASGFMCVDQRGDARAENRESHVLHKPRNKTISGKGNNW